MNVNTHTHTHTATTKKTNKKRSHKFAGKIIIIKLYTNSFVNQMKLNRSQSKPTERLLKFFGRTRESEKTLSDRQCEPKSVTILPDMLQQITHALLGRPLSLSIQNVNPLRIEFFDQISRMILLFVLLLLFLWSMGAIELTVTRKIWSRATQTTKICV